MDICMSCGRIAPTELYACQVCQAGLGRRSTPNLEAGLSWAALRCQFQCRSCGHLSPLDFLDVDGSVICRRCGLEQAFAVASWTAALDHAHAVTDLAGPDSEGRHPHPRLSIGAENPFADIGVARTEAGYQASGTIESDGLQVPASLRLFASPGHPLCPDCAEPLKARSDRRGELRLSCNGCGAQQRHEVPPRALDLHPALVGAIAGEHRCDAAAATVEAPAGGQGAIAIRCPSCGAPLEVAGAGQVVICAFCHTPARIPSRDYVRLVSGDVAPATWWVLLRGPSTLRAALEHPPSSSAASAGRPSSARKRGEVAPGVETPEVLPGPLLLRLAVAIGLPLLLLALAAVIY